MSTTAYVNRFTITHGDVVRISFHDDLSETKEKIAVAMTPADAVELANAILKLAEQVKAQKS